MDAFAPGAAPEIRPLPALRELVESHPLDPEDAARVARARSDIAAILAGEDDRLLVVVGPCSIHDPTAALEFARGLSEAARLHRRELMLVMRAYFEKPRTVLGWNGWVNDPAIDGSFDVGDGLRRTRGLLWELTRLGVAAATEFLDPLVGQYYADFVALGMIGARTVESQVHRALASGLPMPVGFKNRTDGDVSVAVDAIRAARAPHWVPALTADAGAAVRVTSGNASTHLVLRGGTAGPNYQSSHVKAAAQMLRRFRLPARVLVDCSHANSGRNPDRQPAVASEVAAQVRAGEPAIAGVMIESHLVGGMQDPRARPLVYGQSITDGCLPWARTRSVLEELAEAVSAARTEPSLPEPSPV